MTKLIILLMAWSFFCVAMLSKTDAWFRWGISMGLMFMVSAQLSD